MREEYVTRIVMRKMITSEMRMQPAVMVGGDDAQNRENINNRNNNQVNDVEAAQRQTQTQTDAPTSAGAVQCRECPLDSD